MEPAGQKSSRKRSPAPVAPAGELVVQNGKKIGMRRPLCKTLTCIGQAPACELRLQGISPFHCLLIRSPAGLELRDLDSSTGTMVNGKRVARVQLHDGDMVQVGAFQFRLQLPPSSPETPASPAENADALRVGAAAVAAQQSALTQDEDRLHKRLQALEQQEEQLSRHLEEKRKKLLQLHESAQSERTGLSSDRQAYEKFVQQVCTDLTQAQRELVDKQQQLQAERRRLSALHQRLKQRWQRSWKAEKQKHLLREEELANEEANLARESDRLTQEREVVHHERLASNGHYELGRRQLVSAWTRLRQAQQKWRQRRSQERAALRLRGQDMEEAELQLVETQRCLEQEKTDWHNRRLTLEKETEALNTRIHNQRDKIFEQQQEIGRLDAVLRQRRQGAAATENGASMPILEERQAPEAPAQAPPQAQADDALWQGRLADLDRLAGELADQRLQLAEQWQRLVQTQHRWQEDRDQAAAELEALGTSLQNQERTLTERQQEYQSVCAVVRDKHDEVVRLRQHLVGWHTRLRAREATWEGERGRLLGEVRQREKLVQEHLSNLVEVRRRWAKNRRQEVAKLQAERRGCEGLRQEYAILRLEWQRRGTALEDEKRSLAEKLLALEQFRQETISHSGNSPAAEHRVERLRRNWLTQNAAAIRAVAEERKVLEAELADLEKRATQLQKRGDEVVAAETAFAEKHAAWEHKQALLAARHAQIQQELKMAQSQRQGAEQQLAMMKDEVERIARALLDEPEPPALLADRAA